MSPSESRNGREADSIPDGGILAALPRARPQRTSARRAAARANTSTKTSTATETKKARATSAERPVAGKKAMAGTKPAATTKPASTKKRTSTTKRVVKPTDPPAPKQGYEPEEELELGKTVNPPSGVELVESVADIIGELANSGVTAGGRLLKDAFSLLRRP
jgi:hypothetical protein